MLKKSYSVVKDNFIVDVMLQVYCCYIILLSLYHADVFI